MREIELIRAAANNDLPALQQLLGLRNDPLMVSAGRYPDIDAQEDLYGNTALHLAKLCNHHQAAQMLANAGVRTDILNDRGCDAFGNQYAVFQQAEQQLLGQHMAGDVQPFDPHCGDFSYL